MADSILDDAKALLDKDFGDDRILKQICRAYENNEIISNYERNYVKELAEKHLEKKPEFTETHVQEKPLIPDVVIPNTQQTMQAQSYPTVAPRIARSRLKNKKIMFGIVGLALIVIVTAAVSFSGFTIDIGDIDPARPSASLSVQTDLGLYNSKDLISINGASDTAGTVTLSIVNPDNKLVWTEQISLKSDGSYSTLTIAGGSDWEKSGLYTLKVDNDRDTESVAFSFTA